MLPFFAIYVCILFLKIQLEVVCQTHKIIDQDLEKVIRQKGIKNRWEIVLSIDALHCVFHSFIYFEPAFWWNLRSEHYDY